MPRIALIGDSHFDESPGGRFDECVRVHDWIVDDLVDRRVELALHSGDVFERKSTARERNAVRAWAQRVTDQCPLVIVRGNHDHPGDLQIFGHLRTRHPIIVEERAAVHAVAGVTVGCLAWPTKASVLAAVGDVSKAEGEQVASDALRNVLRGLGQGMANASPRAPRVLLAHAMVRGSRVSTGQPLVGADLEVSIDDLRLAGAELYALGHIHMPQDWDGDRPGAVVYPGSPRRTAFGEIEAKGYIISEIEPGHLEWHPVPTPCAPMLLLEAEWVGDRLAGNCDREHDVTGADIRVRYSFPAEHRSAAVARAEEYRDALLADGAASVKLDPQVITTSKARAPEVAKARTLPAKLSAVWRARNTTPDPARAERLLGYAADLEKSA